MLALRPFVLGVVLGAVAVLAIWILSTRKARTPPIITAVSSIAPKQEQEIIIEGYGFGHYTSFKRLDTPFLAIRDNTAHWAAGRITPENPGDVTLTVTTWIDTDIIVTEFSGDYGRKWYKLNQGDEIEVRVWNPQTGAGPATYTLRVAALAAQE